VTPPTPQQAFDKLTSGDELTPEEVQRIRQFIRVLEGSAWDIDEFIGAFKSAGLELLPGVLIAGLGAVRIDHRGIRLLQSTGVSEPDEFATVGFVNKASQADFFGRLGSFQNGDRATLHLSANEDPGFDPVRKQGLVELVARGLDGTTWTISGIEVLTEAEDVAGSGVHKVARIYANDSVSGVTREFLAAIRSFGAGGGPTRLEINGQMEDIDFVVYGDTVESVLRVDASTNQVIVNDQQGDADFRVHGAAIVDVLRVDASADNVGVGAPPNANTILDVVSTTKAFRPPVMTTTQRDNIASPQNGMIIWNSTTGQLEDYNGGWAAV